MALLNEKSEIFFLYETQYSQPNGDPFTGEQRYDEETKKVLVSDVRIKRFIRDFLEEKGYPILVSEQVADGKKSMKDILKTLSAKFKEDKELITKGKVDILKLMQKHIDVRLFGGISTLEKKEEKLFENSHTQITGPVQFALLNPSLNSVDLRPHVNTSILLSKDENQQGAIATTSTVPYALLFIRGWVNPVSAKYSGLKQDDLDIMLRALWDSVNDVNTRSKHGTSLLLIQVVYNESQSKVYGLDRKITITPTNNKKEEAIRAFDEISLDLSGLIKATGVGMPEVKEDDKSQIEKPIDKIKEVRVYTEIEEIKAMFMEDNKPMSKVKFFEFPEYNSNSNKTNESTNANS